MENFEKLSYWNNVQKRAKIFAQSNFCISHDETMLAPKSEFSTLNNDKKRPDFRQNKMHTICTIG